MRCAETTPRVLKTAWFAKKAKIRGIPDATLCKAAKELEAGQGDNLGGNVWKKRLYKNTKRGIVVNKVDLLLIRTTLRAA